MFLTKMPPVQAVVVSYFEPVNFNKGQIEKSFMWQMLTFKNRTKITNKKRKVSLEARSFI